MQLQKLSDSALLSKLEGLGSAERATLVTVLQCLCEVNRRKLFSELGHTSLFDYCTKKLRYPEDQAQRRIVAMRTLTELPEIELEITRGTLNLTTLGLLDSHFRHEQVTNRDRKLELTRASLGKSKREVESMLAKMAKSPVVLKPDQIRVLSETHIELRFVAKTSLRPKIEKIRDELAHKHPSLSLGHLFELLCDIRAGKPNDNPPAPARVTPRQRKPSLRRQVFERDNHQCTRCHSTHALEIDHIIPKAKGGPTTLGNLRLLCRSCNQRAAINEFGQEKMDQHL